MNFLYAFFYGSRDTLACHYYNINEITSATLSHHLLLYHYLLGPSAALHIVGTVYTSPVIRTGIEGSPPVPPVGDLRYTCPVSEVFGFVHIRFYFESDFSHTFKNTTKVLSSSQVLKGN